MGHTHVPFYFYANDEVEPAGEQIIDDFKLVINPDMRYMINIGSVGQPRYTDPRACFGIFDDEKKEIMIKRIAYDIGKTQDQMRKYNLPKDLIERIKKGI